MNTRLTKRQTQTTGDHPPTIHGIRTLTGHTMLLPFDEAIEYQQHIDRFSRDYQPVGEREVELVQSLADAQWRLNQIPGLEQGFYALARVKHASLFADEVAAVRDQLIESLALSTYREEFSALRTQETQLRRNFAKDLSELRKLQKNRGQRDFEPKQPTRSKPFVDSSDFHVTLSAPDSGFDFSGEINQLFHHPALAPGQPLERPFI